MARNDTPDFGSIKADPSWKVAVIRSVWYPELTKSLVDGAVATLAEKGLSRDNIIVIDAPGSYELPLLCQTALEHGCDGAIAFGIVVQGATHHARLISEASAMGCMQAQLSVKKPIIYEVLFVDNVEDARIRAVGPKGKGPLAALTLLTQLARIAERG